MSRGILVPDRRRKYFPLNGGPKPSPDAVERAHQGLDEARRVLHDVESHRPESPRVTRRISDEEVSRAQKGIARARRALETSNARPANRPQDMKRTTSRRGR